MADSVVGSCIAAGLVGGEGFAIAQNLRRLAKLAAEPPRAVQQAA